MYEERSAVKIKGRASARPCSRSIQVVIESADNLSIAGSLEAARSGGSRLQNGSGSGEDSGRTMVGDFLFGLD
jgi:hypothetical protein